MPRARAASRILAKRVLRPPLVVTIAVSASVGLFQACGGAVQVVGNPPPPDSGDDGNTLEAGDHGDIFEDGPIGPGAPACPPTEPALGLPCPGPYGYECQFVDGCSGRGDATLVCQAGSWTLVSAPPATCPPTAPAYGSSCGACAGRGLECAYGEYCPFDCTDAGIWSPPLGCNPPLDAGMLPPTDAADADADDGPTLEDAPFLDSG